MFDVREETETFRNHFMEQILISAEFQFLFLGFFDCNSGDVADSWLVKKPDCPPNACNDLIRDLRRTLAVQSALQQNLPVAASRKKPLWLRINSFMLGIGLPVADMLPVMVVPAETSSEQPSRQAMLRIAMAYVQQQLTESVYSRSCWPDGLVEATLQTLSLRFLIVNGLAEVQRDGRLDDLSSADDVAWIVGKGRLTLESDKERKQLHDAIRAATGATRRTSIIPVSTTSEKMRLAVVAPLGRTVTPLAIVLFEHSGTDHPALREHFFCAYELTSSERRVAHVLLDGDTLKVAAETTDLTLATVRTYLKQIFSKTGTHRQSELIALYYRSILPVGTSIVSVRSGRSV